MIDNGQLVLPEFQRDFDWGSDRVAQLLATIAKKWPIGSLLLQEFPGETFYKLRPIEGGPMVDARKVRYVALDGQQRLTSLYQALYETGGSVFAVRATALQQKPNVSDLEEAIKAFDYKEWRGIEDSEIAPGEWIPFSVLKNPVEFFTWRDRILARTPEVDRASVGDLLSSAYKNGLEAFHTYRIPSTIVESGLEPEAVARIFERVNRGGIPLGAFDLMVARTFEPEWNLRDKWEEACEAYPKLRSFFGEDGIPVIRVISLEYAHNVREGSVLSLPPGVVRGRWQDAVMAVVSALDFLEDYCGVVSPAVLPYGGFTTVLAAIAMRYSLTSRSAELVSWYLSRAFGLRFEGAVNTISVEEYDHLVSFFGGDDLKSHPMVSVGYLASCTRKRKAALWRAFINLLNIGEPIDLLAGTLLKEERVIVSLLTDSMPLYGMDEPQNQLILGNVLASEDSYREMSKEGMESLHKAEDGSNYSFEQRLRSQLLPDVSVFADDRLGWINERAELVDNKLRYLVGYGLSE